MQTGATISGGAHAALIALAFLSGMDLWANDPPELLVVTEVTLIRADQFDVITSAAPAMPVMDMADMAQPDAAFDAPVAPEADIAPQDSELEETAEPDSADLEPDLTALLLIEQPEVSNVDVMPVIAPQLDESAPAIFQPAQNGNELNAPLTSISAPPLRNAPRIDTTAALRPPEDALPDTESAPAVDDGPGEVVEDTEVQEATAPAESTTEITPEGQENVEISTFAPQTAARPPRRPRNLRIPDPVEVEPDTLEEDAILAAIWQAEADAAEAAANAPQPAAELTGVERAAIGDAIEWNSVAFSGQENIEDYVIVVSVDVDSTGLILRETIELLEPASPTGLYTIIYRDARIGIIRSERIPLPAGQYPNGATLHLRFNPASGAVGIN